MTLTRTFSLRTVSSSGVARWTALTTTRPAERLRNGVRNSPAAPPADRLQLLGLLVDLAPVAEEADDHRLPRHERPQLAAHAPRRPA